MRDEIEEIERRVRERGVRVEERLALLRRLVDGDGPGGGAEGIQEEVAEQAAAVRRAAARVRGELS